MPRLGIWFDSKGKERTPKFPQEQGIWTFDEDDYLLMAMLQDPVYCSELLGEDVENHPYGGAFRVRDYQYPLFRANDNYCGFTCARAVGKTESIKWRAVTHAFRRIKQNLLLTAPELIHLLPLTDAIEHIINSVRLVREFLDHGGQKTGFTHRPFGVDFADGTKIVGRIPRLQGTGVHGQHQPDLIIDESQSYPAKGWTEVHEQTPLDGYVLTAEGPRLLRDLDVGDEVLGRDGHPTKILGMSPITEREVYEVRLDDGAVLEADAEHRWVVICNWYLGESKWQRRSTEQIAADLQKPGKAFGSPGQPWLLPDVGPAQHPARILPLDPYTLGVLIGDGSLTHSLRLSTPPEKEPVRADCALVGHDRFTRQRDQPGKCPQYGIVGGATARALDRLGLKGVRSTHRFIPPEYLYAGVDQRLALLQGLVDTDGNVDKFGAIRFGTSSDRLADDVQQLIYSLGGRMSRTVARNPGDYKDGWCLFFRLPPGLVPTRHRPGYRQSSNDKLRRRIVEVRAMGRMAEMRCIQVEDPEHIFLLDGYVPTSNTVMKDTVDRDGNPDFHYHFYGVHSGARDTGFYKRMDGGAFRIITVTAIQRPGWNEREKEAAKSAYGGSSAPDYRRNILGEPGGAASPFFVTARLVACLDQNRDSRYNTMEAKPSQWIGDGGLHQLIRGEDFRDYGLPIEECLDLPAGLKNVWVGADLGLTVSPTVLMIFNEEVVNKQRRLKLYRRIHMERMRTKEIRRALYAIADMYGTGLKGVGMDITGLGFPIFQEMEDDERCPPHLLEVTSGYFFNAKVEVGVDKENIRDYGGGHLRDHLGVSIEERVMESTGEVYYVTWMSMVEASTRFLREMVDSTFLLMPFDTQITGDMQGETQQRVKRLAGLKQKPNAFHILDAMRGMAMKYRQDDIQEMLREPERQPVLDVPLWDAGQREFGSFDYEGAYGV